MHYYCTGNIVYFFAALCSDPSNTIHTEPVFVRNTLARNFSGLKLSIKLLLDEGYSYKWVHPDFTRTTHSIYNPLVSCANYIQSDFQVTCKRVSCEGLIYIISSLTLMFPLDRDVKLAVIMTTNLTDQVQRASIDIKVGSKLTSI